MSTQKPMLRMSHLRRNYIGNLGYQDYFWQSFYYTILYLFSVSSTTARRNPYISHSIPMCYKQKSSSITILVLLSHEQVFLLGFEHPLQAISDSESFLLCEHFHIRIIRLRISVADRRFSLYKTCIQAFAMYLTTIISL